MSIAQRNADNMKNNISPKRLVETQSAFHANFIDVWK